ncbi:MAG TPA: hypothetical protein VIH57_00245 [Bacteroidales bacterium]
MKTYLMCILSLLFLSGCMKDNNNAPEITIDYTTFGYVISWTEIGSKTGGADWKDISNGQRLTFFSNSVDEKLGLPNNGLVTYKPVLNIHIKDNLSFQRIDGTLVFYYYPFTAEADTVSLPYKLIDGSTLVISDTTVIPPIQIKYRREN